MRLAGNVLWLLTGGIVLGIFWYLVGAFMFLTVLLAPWGKSCFELGKLSFAPFGKDIVKVSDIQKIQRNNKAVNDPASVSDVGSGIPMGVLRLFGNIIWLVFGVPLAILHILHGIILLFPIITIPFGLQEFKIAGMALVPVGKRVVSVEFAKEVRTALARQNLGFQGG